MKRLVRVTALLSCVHGAFACGASVGEDRCFGEHIRCSAPATQKLDDLEAYGARGYDSAEAHVQPAWSIEPPDPLEQLARAGDGTVWGFGRPQDNSALLIDVIDEDAHVVPHVVEGPAALHSDDPVVLSFHANYDDAGPFAVVSWIDRHCPTCDGVTEVLSFERGPEDPTRFIVSSWDTTDGNRVWRDAQGAYWIAGAYEDPGWGFAVRKLDRTGKPVWQQGALPFAFDRFAGVMLPSGELVLKMIDSASTVALYRIDTHGNIVEVRSTLAHSVALGVGPQGELFTASTSTTGDLYGSFFKPGGPLGSSAAGGTVERTGAAFLDAWSVTTSDAGDVYALAASGNRSLFTPILCAFFTHSLGCYPVSDASVGEYETPPVIQATASGDVMALFPLQGKLLKLTFPGR